MDTAIAGSWHLRSGVSAEAQLVESALDRLRESTEQSESWFGAKADAIAGLSEVARDCGEAGWDGADADAVNPLAVARAEAVIRAWPAGLELPQVAAEPDGALSLDWIRSRHRVFSLSVGAGDRLAYAWIDGSDRGHGAVRFAGDAVPSRVVDGVRRLFADRHADAGIGPR